VRIILDTNVLSEPVMPVPDPNVRAWFSTLDPEDIHTTAVSLAELYRGVALLPPSARRDRYLSNAWGIEHRLCRGRVLPFGAPEASIFGDVVAERSKAGRPITLPDAMIAAIAITNRLPLATRNTRDFALLGIDLVDPFG